MKMLKFVVSEVSVYVSMQRILAETQKLAKKTRVKVKKLPFFKVGKELREARNSQKIIKAQ